MFPQAGTQGKVAVLRYIVAGSARAPQLTADLRAHREAVFRATQQSGSDKQDV
jgi:hypothetical protein